MNDIHGFGIFDAGNYKTRVLGDSFPNFTQNDAFFARVTDNTKAFTKSLLAEIAARHTTYNGGEKLMTEIPLPAEVKVQPIAVGGKVVDWLIVNPKENIAVSQALLGHCFGPMFSFHVDQRNFQNKDGSITTIPTLMVNGNSRRFYRTCERFANDLNGITDTYGVPNNDTKPQMQYPLSEYYERLPEIKKRSTFNAPYTVRKAGYNQLGGFDGRQNI